jgi:hypothetical protein
MKTVTETPDAALIAADNKAAMASALSGQSLDPEIARRNDERAERVTERLRRKHGVLDVAVEVVRETRDSQ